MDTIVRLEDARKLLLVTYMPARRRPEQVKQQAAQKLHFPHKRRVE